MSEYREYSKLEKALLERNGSLTALCAAAYQIVGAADGPVEMLDNLAAAARGGPLPHDPMAGLPWTPFEAPLQFPLR